MTEDHIQIYDFGSFRLDPMQRRLRRKGQLVPLTAKLLDILLLLVRRAGQVVHKEELMREVWPDCFVEENNLTVSISALRKALGERPRSNQYIETVPKRGYRFVARVHKQPETAHNAVESQASALFARAAAGQAQRAAITSLAVLPLVNTTADPDWEYLADGLTESIINHLSQLSLLKIMARSTTFHYKNKKATPLAVGRELGVSAVMTGRIVRLGDRLMISVELADVADGAQLWGEQYNRPLADILAVQEEIAQEVSEKLRLKLSVKEKKLLARRYTDNTEAYQLYLKGRYFWNKCNHDWVLKGIKHFRQAIRLDPAYALAYAGLADSYFRLSDGRWLPQKALAKAKAAALKAVEIDETLAEGHASLGLLKVYYDFDWAGAEREYRRAIELSPGFALAYQRYGAYLMYMKRFQEAAREYALAQELDPLSLRTSMIAGTNLFLAGQYDQAVAQLRKTLELEPNYFPAHFGLGYAYCYQGKYEQALTVLQQAGRLEDDPLALGLIGYIYALIGKRGEARKALQELREISRRRYISPYNMAIIHIGLQEKAQAFVWLEKLYAERSSWLIWLRVAPEFDALRADARFAALLRRIGLAEE